MNYNWYNGPRELFSPRFLFILSFPILSGDLNLLGPSIRSFPFTSLTPLPPKVPSYFPPIFPSVPGQVLNSGAPRTKFQRLSCSPFFFQSYVVGGSGFPTIREYFNRGSEHLPLLCPFSSHRLRSLPLLEILGLHSPPPDSC